MKRMKISFILSLFLIYFLPTYAQRGEKIEALRIAFITNKLALTAAESEKFWPVYNIYRNTVSEIRKQSNIDMNLEAMNDADAEKAIQSSIERMEKELNLFKNLARDLKPILPARKIAILSKVERNFNEELIRKSQLGEGRQGLLRRN
ncbi:MAG: sensor of ECF-type sigma factor [Saprospiraceae bacterium]